MTTKTPEYEDNTTTAPVSDKCADRVHLARDSRLDDLARFNAGVFDEEDNPDGYKPDEDGEPNEYGLSLDFVEAHAFDDQPRGFVRFQISYGGPQEEFRIYADGEIEFWLLDWFDGASRRLDGWDARTVREFLHMDGYSSVQAWAVDMLRDYDPSGWGWDE